MIGSLAVRFGDEELTYKLERCVRLAGSFSSVLVVGMAATWFASPTTTIIGQAGVFYSALGEMRGTFGVHLTRIAAQFRPDIEDQLASILPAKDEEVSD